MVTSYFKNLVANNVWHTAGASSLPSTYWLALSSTQPLENGMGVTEPSTSSGYARIEMTGLTAASNGVVNNKNALSWPKQVLAAGSVKYWALYDAKTGGNLLMGNPLDAEKHLDAGTVIVIQAAGLTLSVVGA